MMRIPCKTIALQRFAFVTCTSVNEYFGRQQNEAWSSSHAIFLSNCHVQFHHCLTVHRFQTSVNQIISVRLTSSEAIQKSIKYSVKSIQIDAKIYFFSLIIYLFIMEIMIEVQ